MKPTAAIVQSTFDFAIREINALETRIVKAEDDADEMLWDQARQVVEQLKAGRKQGEIARQWINARSEDQQSYSHVHVHRTAKAYKLYVNVNPRPRFRDAYNEVANAAPKQSVHHSSESSEHYTPPEIVEAVVACLGTIDLDPCSNEGKRPNIPARHHYTAVDDGLSKDWKGKTLYMNPPYGDAIDDWVAKLCDEHAVGHVEEAIALVPARTDTQWFARLRDHMCCFVTGRLTFVGNDDPAPFPSAVFYLGADHGKFYRHFSGFGDIWQRIEPGMFGE